MSELPVRHKQQLERDVVGVESEIDHERAARIEAEARAVTQEDY